MNKAILGWLAVALLLPATSFAHGFFPGRRDAGYEPVYRDPPWRAPRRHGPGFDHFYHWHPAERFDRFEDRWDRPWFRFER